MVELIGIEATRSPVGRPDPAALHERGGSSVAPPSPPGGRRFDPIDASSTNVVRARVPRLSDGGADRDRTDDLLSAIQALSQTELQPHTGIGEGAENSTGEPPGQMYDPEPWSTPSTSPVSCWRLPRRFSGRNCWGSSRNAWDSRPSWASFWPAFFSVRP